MLLRLAYLTVSNVFALLRLLPVGDRDKDAEILALRHQLAVLQRQLGEQRVRFTPTDRALLAALLLPLPRQTLHRLRLLVRPLHPLPTPITDPNKIARLDVCRHDRLGGILYEYQHAA